MWGESSKNCENNCQCSGLITDSFTINSGNNATKRKQEDASAHNFKFKMNPHSLNFNKTPSPIATPSKRKVLGEIQNSSPLFRKISPSIERLKNSSFQSSPLKDWNSSVQQSPINRNSPLIRNSPVLDRNSLSPLTSRNFKRSTSKISRIFEERSKFKMSNKENESLMSETFVKLDVEEETRDCSFGDTFQSAKMNNWSMTKLDFTDALPPKSYDEEMVKEDIYVPENHHTDMDPDFETLHDLEEEFENDNFDECTKYEIISTDSPDIISRGRSSSSRKVNSRNFVFGAPISDSETSTSFNKPNANATRVLNFEDENFEFTSPAAKRPASTSVSVKKSLKFSEVPAKTLKFSITPTKTLNFSETPTKNPLRHERSDSSIGSMNSMNSMNSFTSPASNKLRIFTSESTTSMESGFISELEEPFLEIEESSNSPKMANFNDLLSGPIKDNIITDKDFLKRPPLHRSLSFNPECSRVKVSLLSILESPVEKKTVKRTERSEDEDIGNKRRKSNILTPDVERVQRPVLQRAFSENNASIMSALTRSLAEPDLIGDFSRPFALPLAPGHHSDLRSISCDTLADLLRGQFHDTICDFQVIDCRYPYEFEGGHICGALNYHTPAQVLSMVADSLPQAKDHRRRILVFHCEFSRERGPKLSRFLRSSDRAKNKENYPTLHYPEVYLLHEGYRAFYQRYPDLCSPAGYTAMLDPRHKHLLRQHRSISQPSSSTHHRRQRLLL